jgi:hypothetical protein
MVVMNAALLIGACGYTALLIRAFQWALFGAKPN